MAGSQDFIRAAAERKAFFDSKLQELLQEQHSFDSDIASFNQRLTRNRQETSSYLLGEATDKEVRSLQKRLNYPSLMNLKQRFEAELADCERQLAELERDEEAPHTDLWLSRVRDEIDEVKEVYERLSAQVAVWRGIGWFLQLEARGYFGPGYKTGLFGWFSDWRAISLLMAELESRLPETRFADPTPVREAWQKLDEESQPIFELWTTLMQRQTSLLELQGRYNDLKSAPQRLFAQMYEALSEAIANHLQGLDDETRLQLAAGDKALIAFLQKDAGLTKQIQYLKEVKVTRLQPLIKRLEQDNSKLNAKMTKARRKPKFYSDQEIAGLRNLDADKWARRKSGVSQVRTRIGGFNKYDKGSFTHDYLWWDVMTGGARADDIYEVRVFRQNNPHFDHRHYDAPWGSGHTGSSHHGHSRDADLASALAMDAAADALAGDLSAGEGGWAGDPS